MEQHTENMHQRQLEREDQNMRHREWAAVAAKLIQVLDKLANK